jgi:galactitol PTS system EIIA component
MALMADKGNRLAIESDLIETDMEVSDRWEAIDRLAALLRAKGYVRETFCEKVKEREREFPTALPTSPVSVAIPHTSVEHCVRPAIAVGVLKRPIPWIEMATIDHVLDAQVVLLLSITEPEKQVRFLQRVVDFFTSADNLTRLLMHEGVENVRHILVEGVGDEQEDAVATS